MRSSADENHVFLQNGRQESTEQIEETDLSRLDFDLANETATVSRSRRMIYEIEESPGWFLSGILGIQHCLLAVGGLIGMPIVFSRFLCMGDDDIGNKGVAMVINSMFFVSGIATIMQTTIGVRLPIMQGASAAFVSAITSILSLPHNQCPAGPINTSVVDAQYYLYNDTDGTIVDGTELWQRRMRQVQGALIVSSLFEIVTSLTGIAGFLLRFIGPLVVAPCITLIGLSLVRVAIHYASGHWGITAITFTLLIIFSQYLKDVKVPFLFYNTSVGFHVKKTDFFKLFSVLISIFLACCIAAILTVTGALPDDPKAYGYRGRTDIKIDVLRHAPWLRVPYPGQWGLPVVTLAGVVGTVVSTMISMVESTGDYVACAKSVRAPDPPVSAFNRGLAMEGFGSLIAAVVGTSTVLTSYTQNIAAIEITRVGSRRVLQAAGVLFFVMGMIGKFGGLVVIIPDPVIGGLFCVMYGMITAIGMSTLKHVNLSLSRNLFVMGFAVFVGLTVPQWARKQDNVIETEITTLNQVVKIILESELILGFVISVFLDNTLPGTLEERGMKGWMKPSENNNLGISKEKLQNRVAVCYNMPFRTDCFRFARYIPFLPEFDLPRKEKTVVNKDRYN